MQTRLPTEFLKSAKGQQANDILRSCVHCGFCNATCPTFLLTGNELDGPRGRIYLIKEMLEGGPASKITQSHLDRCLSCQSCETTCPSSVQYHSLLNIGREYIETKVGRSYFVRLKHFLIRQGLNATFLFNTALKVGRLSRPILPSSLRKKIPSLNPPGLWPIQRHTRKMLILNGCVQAGLSPNTNAASARVLDKLAIQLITLRSEVCCGALNYHLNAQEQGLVQAKHNIDLIFEGLNQGAEAVLSTASGCGNFIKDYADLLKHDDDYADKASTVVAHCKDISEILDNEKLDLLKIKPGLKLAFQSPCSLQHGQGLGGKVEGILKRLGFTLSKVSDGHLCCGSAGTYSILQPELAQKLQKNKIAALEKDNPDAIATANIGCQSHLAQVSNKPVKHWIEYLDEALT